MKIDDQEKLMQNSVASFSTLNMLLTACLIYYVLIVCSELKDLKIGYQLISKVFEVDSFVVIILYMRKLR